MPNSENAAVEIVLNSVALLIVVAVLLAMGTLLSPY